MARVVLSLSEVRDAEWHAATVAKVIDRKRTFNEPMDRVAILAEVRAFGMDADGGGSRYHHPAACRAVDAAMEERG